MANEGVAHDAGVEEARERVQLRNEHEHDQAQTAQLAEQRLRIDLEPADFEQGRRFLQQHLASLPADERERLARSTTREGTPALADATVLRAIAEQALGPMPVTQEHADEELAAARRRMREDPKGWYADDEAQLRYRMILRRFPPTKPSEE